MSTEDWETAGSEMPKNKFADEDKKEEKKEVKVNSSGNWIARRS
jgi:hypothetical protein